MPIVLIVNPRAGRGRASRFLGRVLRALGTSEPPEILETRAAGDETSLATSAIAAGASTIAVVGGDGTCTKVAAAIFDSRSDCALCVLPAGTGNDFAKVLGVANLSVEDAVAVIKRRDTRRMDVGRVDGVIFLNSCGFGFDPSVLAATKKVRFLKGDAVYIYAALAQLFRYQGIAVSVDQSKTTHARKMLMLTVSNGRFLGGAFRIAPHASVVDGELDVGLFDESGLADRVRVFAAAFRGTHIRLPSVTTTKVRTITLGFSDAPMMELDGELLRARSSTVTIECLPRALNVLAAPGCPL